MDANSFEPVIFDTRSRKSSRSPGQRKSSKSPVERKSSRSPIDRKPKGTTKSSSKVQKESKKKAKPEKKTDLFSSFGLHTVEELFGDFSEGKDVSEVSEVRTESSHNEIHTEEPVHFGQTANKEPESMTEIVSEIKTKEYSIQQKDSYSEDFEPSISERVGMSSKSYRVKSEIRTWYGEATVEDYTEEFASDTESIATVSRTSAGPSSEMTITNNDTDHSDSDR